MSLSRYQWLDEYTSAELVLIYRNADAEERLKLLEQLLTKAHSLALETERTTILPAPIMQLAAADPDPRIRHALARSSRWWDDGIVKQLRQDSEFVVRAAVCEHPQFLPPLVQHGSTWDYADVSDQRAIFDSLSHGEQLALMRNPRISTELVEEVFDSSSLPDTERSELILAYLSRSDGFKNNNYWHFKRMWELASKFEGKWELHMQTCCWLRSSIRQSFDRNAWNSRAWASFRLFRNKVWF